MTKTHKRKGAERLKVETMNIQKKLMTVRNSIKSGKDAYNGFGRYSYRNAEAMLAGINPLLQKQGLTLDFSDEIQLIGARYYMKTTLTVHDTEDGETFSVTSFAREPEQKKGMDESQITGASATYCHKYALMGMFAISDPKLDPDSMNNNADNRQNNVPPVIAPNQSVAQMQGTQMNGSAGSEQAKYQIPIPGHPETFAPPSKYASHEPLDPKGYWNWGYSPK